MHLTTRNMTASLQEPYLHAPNALLCHRGTRGMEIEKELKTGEQYKGIGAAWGSGGTAGWLVTGGFDPRLLLAERP